MTTFGQNVQQLRRRAGMSQQALAEQLHVSRQAVSKWELDAAKPDIDNLMQISALFSVSIDWLLTGTQPEPTLVSPAQPPAADRRAFWLRVFGIVLTAVGLLGVMLAAVSTTWMQSSEMQTWGTCYTDAAEYLRHFPLAVVLWMGLGSTAAGIALFVRGLRTNRKKKPLRFSTDSLPRH